MTTTLDKPKHTLEEIDQYLTTLSNVLTHCRTVDRKAALRRIDKWLDLRNKVVNK